MGPSLVDPDRLIILIRSFPDGEEETVIAVVHDEPMALMTYADYLETGRPYPTREQGAVIWRATGSERDFICGETSHGKWHYHMRVGD